MTGSEEAALRRLSLNTATVKNADLPTALRVAARAGFGAVGLWRDRVAEVGLPAAVELVGETGLPVSSLCRGGFLTGADAEDEALRDNTAAIAEAQALGTRDLVMVVGGLTLPDRDLVAARRRVAGRLASLVPIAREHGVRLVLEALHPMYCADRAVISTLEQALDLAAPYEPETVGVVVDTFHQWWDPDLERQIERAGSERRLAGYQICDWNLPIAQDALLSRGLMGDGYIDFATITTWMERAGYDGPIEVEIFNADIWAADPQSVAEAVRDRYLELVAPYLGRPSTSHP